MNCSLEAEHNKRICETCKKGNAVSFSGNSCICGDLQECSGSNCDPDVSNAWNVDCSDPRGCTASGETECKDCVCKDIIPDYVQSNKDSESSGNNQTSQGKDSESSGNNQTSQGKDSESSGNNQTIQGQGQKTVGSEYSNQFQESEIIQNNQVGENQDESSEKLDINYLDQNKITEFIFDNVVNVIGNKENINELYSEFKIWYLKKYKDDALSLDIFTKYFINKYDSDEELNIINLKLKSKITTIEEETIIIKFIKEYTIIDSENQMSIDDIYKIFQKWVMNNFDDSIMPSKEELQNKLNFSYLGNNNIYNIKIINNVNIFSPMDKFNFLQFFDEKIIIDSTAEIHIDDIYFEFNKWMNVNKSNEIVPSKENIVNYLDSQSYNKTSVDTWKGIKLIQLSLPDPTATILGNLVNGSQSEQQITGQNNSTQSQSGQNNSTQSQSGQNNSTQSQSGQNNSTQSQSGQSSDSDVSSKKSGKPKKTSSFMKYLKYLIIFIIIIFLFKMLTGGDSVGTGLYEFEEVWW
jgi:hypothetical protein